MEIPLKQCYVKATDQEHEDPRYSQNWVTARRGFLMFFDDRIELGDWKFYYNQIQDVVIYHVKQMFIPGKILSFSYNNKHYQIGFNPWINPAQFLPFTPKEEKKKLKMSIFSIIIRVIALGSLAYYLITEYSK